jgi:hypothetical protein
LPRLTELHIQLQTAIQLATLVSVIVGFASLLITINNYRRQMTVQILMKYTERYEHIMSQFPPDAFITRFNSSKLPGQDPALTVCILRYLNLCAEEYYLTKNGYLANDLWHIWEGDLKRMLRSSLLRREWPTLRHEFESHIEFLEYVEQVHADNGAEKASSLSLQE